MTMSTSITRSFFSSRFLYLPLRLPLNMEESLVSGKNAVSTMLFHPCSKQFVCPVLQLLNTRQFATVTTPIKYSATKNPLCKKPPARAVEKSSPDALPVDAFSSANEWYGNSSGGYVHKALLKYFTITCSIAIAYVAYKVYRVINDNERDTIALAQNELGYQQVLATDIEVTLVKLLPLKLVSRLWGWINSVNLPTWLRVIVIEWYCSTFNCCLDEAECGDLNAYSNLGDFFRRALKPGVRPIDPEAIVSPADGVVVHFGKAEGDKIEQVKGVNYSLRSFLGPQTWSQKSAAAEVDEHQYIRQLQLNSSASTSLYHCVIYLAPGDYHRFHSPAEWTVNFRRHFSGKLLSIRPAFMSWIENLFTINERVAYIGKWAHGFFSMTAVGATNVGSIKVYFDEDLKTNVRNFKVGHFKDAAIKQVNVAKGTAFGEFNLGSTIVLVFEGPTDLDICVEIGQRVKYGQKIFNANSSPPRECHVRG